MLLRRMCIGQALSTVVCCRFAWRRRAGARRVRLRERLPRRDIPHRVRQDSTLLLVPTSQVSQTLYIIFIRHVLQVIYTSQNARRKSTYVDGRSWLALFKSAGVAGSFWKKKNYPGSNLSLRYVRFKWLILYILKRPGRNRSCLVARSKCVGRPTIQTLLPVECRC
jgi:hypothetical protein